MSGTLWITLARSFALGAVALVLGVEQYAIAQQSNPPTSNQTYDSAFNQAREACKGYWSDHCGRARGERRGPGDPGAVREAGQGAELLDLPRAPVPLPRDRRGVGRRLDGRAARGARVHAESACSRRTSPSRTWGRRWRSGPRSASGIARRRTSSTASTRSSVSGSAPRRRTSSCAPWRSIGRSPSAPRRKPSPSRSASCRASERRAPSPARPSRT